MARVLKFIGFRDTQINHAARKKRPCFFICFYLFFHYMSVAYIDAVLVLLFDGWTLNHVSLAHGVSVVVLAILLPFVAVCVARIDLVVVVVSRGDRRQKPRISAQRVGRRSQSTKGVV